jgi:hypothetical protein
MKNTAFALGLGGLVPFWGLGLLAITSPPHAAVAASFQQAYAVAILSFLGALHWGAALVGNMPSVRARVSLVWGVVPSLLAWAASTLPASRALPALAAAIALCLVVDWVMLSWHAWPRWYGLLRVLLTVGAVLGVGLTAVAIR